MIQVGELLNWIVFFFDIRLLTPVEIQITTWTHNRTSFHSELCFQKQIGYGILCKPLLAANTITQVCHRPKTPTNVFWP